MFSTYEQFLRQRELEVRLEAQLRRLTDRTASAQRWQRAAAWTAHRAANAERASREVRLVSSLAR